jgi:plasmid stabilization system protein ParE
MDDFDVRPARAAQTDMVDIHRYISTDLSSPMTADKMIDTIEKALASLSFSPQSLPKVRDDRLAAKGYRWLGIKNYVAYFTVDEQANVVNVERILYGRRDWQRLL